MNKIIVTLFLSVFFFSCSQSKKPAETGLLQYSGIYPHLAFYNQEDECGTGAVVPWAGSLWAVTYAPHQPQGSTDKLYEITSDLTQIIRKESVGGTPANRMIHGESNQLFIGPYAIDTNREVRVIPYAQMPGRHTGNARHLFDPSGKIYFATMEEGFYEVDVENLEVTMLYKDGNNTEGNRVEHDPTDVNPENATIVGAHGKGLYSGQGVLVYANNGEASEAALRNFDIEAGALAEWDGKDWKVITRNQFTEVTGPGGINGNPHPDTDPIWSTGWDHKSLLLAVRDQGAWTFYRLPKASHSYDGAHGWNTEWPRIRDVGTRNNPDYLMTMHGMFWRFPDSFTSDNSVGIRPRSSYLKVIGDFARWNERLVFGCDDSAFREFLNKRTVKGNIEGPGQSNSNLWFTTPEQPDQLGPTTATGALWLMEEVEGNIPSDPFLFSGWPKRSIWLKNHGDKQVAVTFEVDISGTKNWEKAFEVTLDGMSVERIDFQDTLKAEWIRLVTNVTANLTGVFSYSDIDQRTTDADPIFQGIGAVEDGPVTGGLLYGLGDNRKVLGLSSYYKNEPAAYYELDEAMNLELKEDAAVQNFIDTKFAIPKDVMRVESTSILIIDDKGRRWRLPKGSSAHDSLIDQARVRISREVATERDLFNCHGTFYELPAENADGFAKIRPVSSHDLRIHDYASYRGLLVMTGINPDHAADNHHVIVSDDGKAAVWAGVIDDLWRLGKPTGSGGPWYQTTVAAGEPSDPYLIGFYDRKTLEISHNYHESVKFSVEVEPLGHGPWMHYQQVEVAAGETYQHVFPEGFQARWIRFITDKPCVATTTLEFR